MAGMKSFFLTLSGVWSSSYCSDYEDMDGWCCKDDSRAVQLKDSSELCGNGGGKLCRECQSCVDGGIGLVR